MSRDMFDTDEEYRKQLFKELIQIAQELGWQVAIPATEDEDEEVPGLIMGTEEYINQLTDGLEDDGFEV